MMPGAAGMPHHSTPRRIAYALVGILLGITGGLGNALTTVNLMQTQGSFGLTPVEGQWLIAAYMMTNVSANLILFKFRQQYGLRLFSQVGMALYVVMTVVHLLVGDFATLLMARLTAGFATSVLSTLGMFYMIQAFGKPNAQRGMVTGLGLSQLGTPVAWILSPSLLDMAPWRPLYLFETGMALSCLAAVSLLHLPTSERIRVFGWRDLITFAMLAPALALLVAVLAQGRIQWWTSQEWIAWALIGALVLGTAAILFERSRKYPLLEIGWIGTSDALRLVAGAVAIRFLLSEQTFGAIGLLRQLGMGPDQLVSIGAVMLIGLSIGTIVSALTIGPKTMPLQVLASIFLIGVAAFIDHYSSNMTRPQNMFLSQTLISIGAGMSLGPLLITTVMTAVKNGSNYMISGAILFGFSQTIGGLGGPALFGTYQQFREHEYSAAINAAVDPTDPVVAARLAIQGQIYARTITDPVLRSAEGAAALARSATVEANVRAYNDVFLLTGLLAIVTLVWSFLSARQRIRHASQN